MATVALVGDRGSLRKGMRRWSPDMLGIDAQAALRWHDPGTARSRVGLTGRLGSARVEVDGEGAELGSPGGWRWCEGCGGQGVAGWRWCHVPTCRCGCGHSPTWISRHSAGRQGRRRGWMPPRNGCTCCRCRRGRPSSSTAICGRATPCGLGSAVWAWSTGMRRARASPASTLGRCAATRRSCLACLPPPRSSRVGGGRPRPGRRRRGVLGPGGRADHPDRDGGMAAGRPRPRSRSPCTTAASCSNGPATRSAAPARSSASTAAAAIA